jgi:hypothetical protein
VVRDSAGGSLEVAERVKGVSDVTHVVRFDCSRRALIVAAPSGLRETRVRLSVV